MDVLEPFLGQSGAARIARQHHRDVFEALAPGVDHVNDGLVARLESGGEIVGVLVSVGHEATTTATDRTVFEIVAGVSALIAQGRRVDDGLATRSADEALLEALDEGTEPTGAVAARAQSVGVDLEALHTVAAFHVLEGTSDGSEAILREHCAARSTRTLLVRWSASTASSSSR